MSDVSGPLFTCDADVVGSDATLNNNSMHVNVTGENIYSPQFIIARLSVEQFSLNDWICD